MLLEWEIPVVVGLHHVPLDQSTTAVVRVFLAFVLQVPNASHLVEACSEYQRNISISDVFD